MSCEIDLKAYVVGEVTRQERSAVEDHVRGCQSCREELDRLNLTRSMLASLEDDAMVQISETSWLRIPVGKLHNDRYVPLHPILVDLINDYRRARGPNRSGRLVVRNDGQPFDRRTIHR